MLLGSANLETLRLYNSVGLESINFAAFGVTGRTPEEILKSSISQLWSYWKISRKISEKLNFAAFGVTGRTPEKF